MAKRFWAVSATLVVSSTGFAQDRTDPNPPEPHLATVYPQAGRRGATWEAEITGRNLEGARGAWFSDPGVTATVLGMEGIKPEKAPESGKSVERDFKITLRIDALSSAAEGIHFLRLTSNLGLSNALQFRIHTDPVISESEGKHATPPEAQPIQLPVVVNGRIAKPGEVDQYAFDVSQGQEIAFDVIASREAAATGFHPQLAIYRVSESWFNPTRPNRIAFTADVRGEVVFQNGDPRDRSGNWVRLRHRFAEAGRYYLEVGSVFGKGGPENSYQLLAADSSRDKAPEFWQQHLWRERDFTRRLGDDHVRALQARTLAKAGAITTVPATTANGDAAAAKPGPAGLAPIPLDAKAMVAPESEPNDTDAQALAVSLPAILEGTVDRESDVDTFRFRVARGQKLAFEIETPAAAPPDFNPRYDVFDAKGAAFLSSLARTKEFKNSKSVYLVAVEPKVVATFEQEGEYFLRIRDVTRRAGGARFRYRLMIRPQIPHVGDVLVETRTRANEDATLDPWRVNLRPGEARKLNVTVEHEEGFYQPANLLAIQVEGLPAGVVALTGSSNPSLASRFSGPSVEKPERYQPTRQDLTVVLDAAASAAATDQPVMVRLTARSFVQGKPGPSFLLGELPVMILGTDGKK